MLAIAAHHMPAYIIYRIMVSTVSHERRSNDTSKHTCQHGITRMNVNAW
jgi:hypothetical protein